LLLYKKGVKKERNRNRIQDATTWGIHNMGNPLQREKHNRGSFTINRIK